MHPRYPMAGHVLPVIFSWHLKVQINAVAKDAAGALDPDEFWHAWAGGAAATVDTFAPDWDFWAHVEAPLRTLRTRWGWMRKPDGKKLTLRRLSPPGAPQASLRSYEAARVAAHRTSPRARSARR